MKNIYSILTEAGMITESVGQIIRQQIRMLDKWALAYWGAGGQGRFANFTDGEAKYEKFSIPHGVTTLVYMSGKATQMKWDPENIDPNLIRFFKGTRGGLILKVKGSKHSGFIIISLSGKDLYDIASGSMRGAKWKHKDTKSDIYAEDLVNVINDMVG